MWCKNHRKITRTPHPDAPAWNPATINDAHKLYIDCTYTITYRYQSAIKTTDTLPIGCKLRLRLSHPIYVSIRQHYFKTIHCRTHHRHYTNGQYVTADRWHCIYPDKSLSVFLPTYHHGDETSYHHLTSYIQLIRFPLSLGKCSHPHLVGTVLKLKHWSLSLSL